MIKKIINNIFFIYNKIIFKNFFSKSLKKRQAIIKKDLIIKIIRNRNA